MFSANKKMITLSAVIIFFIVLDRFFKFLALNFSLSPIKLIGGLFSFNLAKNYNIAFSLPLSGSVLNISIVFIVLGLLYYLLYLLKNGRYQASVFLFAVILGALSNLMDRFKYGYVIDYLDLKYFTVFNLADAMIVGGIAGLLWFLRSLDVKKEM